jgi:hypothetical protein
MKADVHSEPTTPVDDVDPPPAEGGGPSLPFFARRMRRRLQVQSGITGGHTVKAAGRG